MAPPQGGTCGIWESSTPKGWKNTTSWKCESSWSQIPSFWLGVYHFWASPRPLLRSPQQQEPLLELMGILFSCSHERIVPRGSHLGANTARFLHIDTGSPTWENEKLIWLMRWGDSDIHLSWVRMKTRPAFTLLFPLAVSDLFGACAWWTPVLLVCIQ